jgi:hypothetical protein
LWRECSPNSTADTLLLPAQPRRLGDGINVEQQMEQRLALQVVQLVMGYGASVAAPQSTAAKPDGLSAI